MELLGGMEDLDQGAAGIVVASHDPLEKFFALFVAGH
jgi:hypothetical protein